VARPNTAQTLLKLAGILVACAVLCAGVLLPYVGGMGLVAGREANKFLNTKCNLIETPPPQKTVFYAKDGTTQLATLYQFDRELVPSLNQVPKYLQQALIATEDRRFYSHHGVDMRGLLRSALNNSSGDTQGGSTLTMQYVKQVRYYQADTDAQRQAAITQTLSRKMEDAQCALEIEKKDSKADILLKYLNIAFFGENSYGIGTAAKNYFGVPVDKLTLPQAALLVGVVKAPTAYDPFVSAHRQAAIDRRNQVIQNLADVHDISQAQADQYKKTDLSLSTVTHQTNKQGCAGANTKILNAGFFCDYVEQYLENTGGLTEKQITTNGMKVVTTLDPSLQNTVQTSLWQQVLPKSRTTAIMPMVDPHTGNVLAMATSKQYGLTNDGGHTTLPIFTGAYAGGGSTYKLFPLLAALGVGVPSTMQLSNNVDENHYKPSNCGSSTFTASNDTEGHNFARTETLGSAIAKSSNTYFVSLEDNLFQACNLQPYVDTALHLGMTSLKEQDPGNTKKKITIAQSVVDQRQPTFTYGYAPTSPLQLTGAYAAVANDGTFCAPSPIVSIKDSTGKDVAVKRSPCATVMTPQVARQAQQVLTGVTHDIGTSASQFAAFYGGNPGASVAGKTGTVNATDAHGNPASTNGALWFAGITPDLAATTALFNIDNPNKPIVGLPGMSDDQAGHLTGDFAAHVWIQALGSVLQGKQWAWPDPNDIPNATPIPSVVGKPFDEAKATLASLGFKPVRTPFDCGSATTTTFGAVAYQSATNVATAGATVQLCVSDGQIPYVWTPPKQIPHHPRPGHSTPPSHGGGGHTPPGGGGGGGGGRSGPPHH
jgi:membrane peptidoglycan carboxypeptidase